ncbi:MAG TPA: methyltransferase domain-containing protein [Fimbriimonadaceae bacterium]|jgi:SAM-dependent methyltransferase
MSPREKYLALFDLSTVRALEFGPADKPWIPRKTPGVRNIDHLSTEDLRKEMESSPFYKAADLCEIHFVNDGRALKEILGDWTNLDLIAASHVIEHLPDVLGWLQDLSAVLAAGGRIMLAVPNKHHTFDFFRQVTTLEDVIVNHLERRTKPSPRAILEHRALATSSENRMSWNGDPNPLTFRHIHNFEEAYRLASEHLDENSGYFDVHVSVFTPYSFVKLLIGLTENGFLPLELERIDPNGFEFLAVLKRCDPNERIADRIAALDSMAAKLPFQVEDYCAAEYVCLEPRFEHFGGMSETDLNKVQELEEQLAQLKGSASWRITKPLRGLRRLFH